MKKTTLVLPFLLAALAACGKPSRPSDAGQPAVSTEPPATPESLLRAVPRDARFTLLLADWGKLYGLVGAVEACLAHHPLGKKLAQQARAMMAMAPVPVPLSAGELAKLGIDAKRPLLLWGKVAPVMSVGIADLATLKKQLGAVWPKSSGQWSPMTHRNVSVEVLAGVRQLFCSFDARRARALCSPHTDALVDALGPAPQAQQSLWDQLSPEEQGAAASTTALLWGGPRHGALLARIEEDGISLSGRIAGVPARQVATIFGAPSPSTLLGLAKDARALLRVRLNARALGGLPPETREELTRLGIAVDKLGDALSGELLAMERRPAEIVAVLASRDSMVSQQIVDALGRTLETAARRAQEKAVKESALPGVKVTKVKLAGKGAYRIEIASTRAAFPLNLTLGLAAGPLGVIAGSWPAVEEIAKVQSAPADALRTVLTTSEERLAFDERSVFAIRSFIGDPIGSFAPALDALLQSQGAPPQVQAGIELARFLLSQLHRLTVGIVADSQGTPRFVVRLMTLHRDGNAEDDRARAVWIKGLQAKLGGGDAAAYDRALQELASTHPKTRYATLLERSKGGLLGTALLGTLAAVAIPALHKYTRRSKMLEVHTNLARVVSSAKFIEGPFPKGTPWTPAKPCCGGRGGKCAPDEKDWDHPTWTALRFKLLDPHYYQYRFTSKGKSFTAEARGDLNCDGKMSSFAIEGTREADGGVKLSPMKTKDPEE